jgi:hypothetical protein
MTIALLHGRSVRLRASAGTWKRSIAKFLHAALTYQMRDNQLTNKNTRAKSAIFLVVLNRRQFFAGARDTELRP